MAEQLNIGASDATGTIIRHSLTAIGLLLAATNVIDDTQVDTIIGAGSMLAGVAWSLYNKQKKNDKIDEALMTPVPVDEPK